MHIYASCCCVIDEWLRDGGFVLGEQQRVQSDVRTGVR